MPVEYLPGMRLFLAPRLVQFRHALFQSAHFIRILHHLLTRGQHNSFVRFPVRRVDDFQPRRVFAVPEKRERPPLGNQSAKVPDTDTGAHFL